jgi:PKD repeat protein
MLINLTIPANIGPVLFVSVPAYANPGVEMTVKANATDHEGDPLTWTFDYGDGLFDVFNTDPTPMSTLLWMNATHVYDELGDYSIAVYVSDALVPDQVGWHNVSTTVFVTVRNNSAPVVAPIGLSTSTLVINDETGVLAIVLSVQVIDADSDPLTVEWDFGDTTDHAFNTTLGGVKMQTFRMAHNYTDSGSFNVTVVVSDTSDHSVSVYRVLAVTSTNRPPVFRELQFEFPLGSDATLNESMGFVLMVYDSEGDALFVAWHFGDGSPSVYLVLTEFTPNNTATVSVNHTYTEIGTFALTVTVTDNKTGIGNHTIVNYRVVDVVVPRQAVVWIWDWWDYTSLALFCMIPITPIIWTLYARRKSKLLEELGLTLEEYKIRKDELGGVLKGKKE